MSGQKAEWTQSLVQILSSEVELRAKLRAMLWWLIWLIYGMMGCLVPRTGGFTTCLVVAGTGQV